MCATAHIDVLSIDDFSSFSYLSSLFLFYTHSAFVPTAAYVELSVEMVQMKV